MPLSFQIGLAIGLLGCVSVFAMVSASNRLSRRYRLRKHSPSQHQSCVHPTGGPRIPFLLVLAGFLMAGCQTTQVGQIIDAISSSSTNSPAVASSNVAAAASDGLIYAGTFVRPAIYADPSGTLCVAAEGPGMASIWRFTLGVNGKWAGSKVVTASKETALRTYVVSVLADTIAFRYGKKEAGKLHGVGTYRGGVERYEGFSTGAARLALSPDGPICMSKNGIWKNLKSGKIGNYNAGQTGEKFSLAISGKNWATCHNGCAKDPSSVSINGKRQVWADYATYGASYGIDMNYPEVAFGPDGSVWCASILNGRMKVQQVVNGKLRWPATALGDLGEANVQDRCPPRLVVSHGRLWAFWVFKGSILRADVENVLSGRGKATIICAGSMPAVSVDANGKTHMVYLAGSALKYRSIP